jgi:hypothetical protein
MTEDRQLTKSEYIDRFHRPGFPRAQLAERYDEMTNAGYVSPASTGGWRATQELRDKWVQDR